ncbi:MAG: PIG-L family deacetylase, partial [Ilumatobacteraceae bacterium]
MAANEPGQPDPSPSLISHDLPTPTSALAIGAHPDDVEFGCGATLAKWAAAGCLVHHLVLTDGSKGTWNASADVATLIATRRHEQRAAARRLAGERAGE